MNDAEREKTEKQILLRSTGELPPEEQAALDAALGNDAEAAEFAEFVAGSLPARAPRDFAAAAIREAVPERKVIAFPLRWKMAAAAAAVAVASLVAVRLSAPEPTQQQIVTAVPPARVTAGISARVDALDAELASTRQRLSRGRYHRQKETL